jgi:hypothetical protein
MFICIARRDARNLLLRAASTPQAALLVALVLAGAISASPGFDKGRPTIDPAGRRVPFGLRNCLEDALTTGVCIFLRPNVRGNRPAEVGGVRLARDSGEAAARQPYAACRSGSG